MEPWLPTFPRRSSRCALGRASGAAGHGAFTPALPSSLRSLRSLRSSVQDGRPHDRAPSAPQPRPGGSMTLTWTDWQAIAVPLVLAIGAVAVLLIDGFWRSATPQLRHTLVTLLTGAVILFGLVFVWAQRNQDKPAFC